MSFEFFQSSRIGQVNIWYRVRASGTSMGLAIDRFPIDEVMSSILDFAPHLVKRPKTQFYSQEKCNIVSKNL